MSDQEVLANQKTSSRCIRSTPHVSLSLLGQVTLGSTTASARFQRQPHSNFAKAISVALRSSE